MAVEKEIEKTESAPQPNAVFDESSNFIIYATLLGIKVRYYCHVIGNTTHILIHFSYQEKSFFFGPIVFFFWLNNLIVIFNTSFSLSSLLFLFYY